MPADKDFDSLKSMAAKQARLDDSVRRGNAPDDGISAEDIRRDVSRAVNDRVQSVVIPLEDSSRLRQTDYASVLRGSDMIARVP